MLIYGWGGRDGGDFRKMKSPARCRTGLPWIVRGESMLGEDCSHHRLVVGAFIDVFFHEVEEVAANIGDTSSG